MIPKPEKLAVPPPRLIAALHAGFDAAANHIALILFPVALDLFLWLGPHFSVKNLLMPILQQFSDLPGMNAPEMSGLMETTRQMWQTLAERLNLASVLRSYPVGIPSLMADQFPVQTPWGTPLVKDIASFGTAFGWVLLFLLIGLIGGSLYFYAVAQTISKPRLETTWPNVGWVGIQSILLALVCFALLLAIGLPILLFLTILAAFSPTIAQIGVLVASVLLIWILVPLLFSPHGIFLFRQNALLSMLTSARLVRFVLPGTSLFFLALVVLSQGLDLLWLVPPEDSWMAFIGVLGHGFIATATLAASFVYYRDALRFVQAVIQRSVAPNSTITNA
ncbi:MAG: hypothetical protein M1281_17975 [Chloroflexi bacterium]|nr:hypothetical protein [Chloroflexota bacterium]